VGVCVGAAACAVAACAAWVCVDAQAVQAPPGPPAGDQVVKISAEDARAALAGACSADGTCAASSSSPGPPPSTSSPSSFEVGGWVECSQGSTWTGAQGRRPGAGVTVAYVTPWNGPGYDAVVKHAEQLDVVIPVWYTVTPQVDPTSALGWSLALEGGQDVDRPWVQRVRDAGKGTGTKVIPRFLLTLHAAGVQAMANPKSGVAKALGKLISHEVTFEGFDGAALDGFWLTGAHAGVMDEQATRDGFLEAIGVVAREVKGQVVLAVPPLRASDEHRGFDASDLARLAEDVDVFSVMTYDFSTTAGRPGPNAPVAWVDATVRRLLGLDLQHKATVDEAVEEVRGLDPTKKQLAAKIAVGLNFYGYDFEETGKGDAVLGKHLVDALGGLETKPRAVWLSSPIAEHTVNYTTADGVEHSVFYPSPASIKARLDVATMYGTGASIWEAGQGLACFWDLL